MPRIEPFVSVASQLCAEVRAPESGIVVFGASGDLAGRKLFPSLFQLYADGLMADDFFVIGCGRTEYSDAEFRDRVKAAIKSSEDSPAGGKLETFAGSCFYVTGGYDEAGLYEKLRERIGQLDRQRGVSCSHVFYMSVPPEVYVNIVRRLGEHGLSQKVSEACTARPRLVIEKPFGKNLETARELNGSLYEYFQESQIYRIDHYLGKETVQNILMLRFANAIFEPIWNRNYVDHVQLVIAEQLGVEHRAGYYDKSGALRDMFQNHMLSMLSLVSMEPPISFDADAVRDEKVKLLRSVRGFNFEPWSRDIVRGQYKAGEVDGEKVSGYRDEEGVDPESKTETYVAARMMIDNWRWRDVPFYLRTGKRMSKKLTEIAIKFKGVPHSLFASAGIEYLPANELVLKIQPDEGLSLSFQAKRPGSKICMGTLNMSFNYADVFGTRAPEAYQRLLLDVMIGDQTLFNRGDDVEVAWQLIDPVLNAWQEKKDGPYEYPAGSDSFAEADELITGDGRQWRKLENGIK